MTEPSPSFEWYTLNDGLNILTLQELLTSAGFKEPMNRLDGSYGLQTAEAVRRYQRANHLGASGTADEDTWDKLTDRTVKKGEPDRNCVVAVQVELFKHQLQEGDYEAQKKAFETFVDGDFGAGTERAVRSFQDMWQLPHTGEVDPTTWRYLIGHGPG
jgi:peptidoglycan hydrolase-like protein with peptidoglycan-binding domain